MTEHSVRPHRQDRCHPFALRVDEWVSDGIDPAMDQVQGTSLEPVSHGSAPQPRRKQLLPAHDPMLCLRQLSEHPIHMMSASGGRTKFTFGPCDGLNVNLVRCLVGHAADDAPTPRACGALNVKRGSNLPLPPLALIP
jgi:hypothetical protein